jgi:membrane dipeptidase
MTHILVDAHIDMAYNAMVLGRDLLRPVAEIRETEADNPPPSESAGTCMTSLPALLEGRVAVVGASIFVAPAFKSWQREPQVYRTPEEANRQAITQLDFYRRLADEDERVVILNATTDLDAVLASQQTDDPQLGLFIVMEGAEPIREPGELDWWVERGVRGVALAWSAGTRYAGGNAAPGGLTDEGRALLDALADYNLLLDISHLWEDAVYEALGRYPGPMVATHANPRAFVDSPRQLSDDLIRRIADREGVVGVVPFNRMLASTWRSGEARLSLNRLVQAIDHICQVTGAASFVGIGSDFDGGFGRESVPEGLDSVADLWKIGSVLAERGYSSSEVTAILSDNWLRVMRQILQGM